MKDIVLWDSHPLALGAAPKQVFIDGIAQLKKPHVSKKPSALQHAPKTPDFAKETEDAIKYDGLPPLEAKKSSKNTVVFTNVRDVHLRDGASIKESFSAQSAGGNGVVVVENGSVVCAGLESECNSKFGIQGAEVETIDLEGGSVS